MSSCLQVPMSSFLHVIISYSLSPCSSCSLFCRKTFRHFIWQYMWSYRFLLLSQLVFDCFYTERCIMKIKQYKEDRIYLCTIHKGYTFLGYLRSTLRPLTWFSLFFKEKNHIYPPKYLPCYKNFRRPTK